jgi:hypothetical protein
MKNQIKTCLKTAWMAAGIAIFFMGTTMCASTASACVEAGKTMFALMLLITFPAGVFFFLASMIFMSADIYDPSDFVIGWFIMMCGGLLQWFVIVPGLFEKPGFTTLNLKTAEQFPRPQDSNPTSSREPITPAAVSLESPTPVPSPAVHCPGTRTKARRKAIKSVKAFDRRGRTPLERVLNRL